MLSSTLKCDGVLLNSKCDRVSVRVLCACMRENIIDQKHRENKQKMKSRWNDFMVNFGVFSTHPHFLNKYYLIIPAILVTVL